MKRSIFSRVKHNYWGQYIFAALMCFLGTVAIAEEVLTNLDFGKAGKEFHVNNKGSFNGFLPEGVQPDFMGWTSSSVSSEKLTEDQRSFLRINVTKFDNTVQFAIVDMRGKIKSGDSFLKCEILFRSASPITAQLRQVSAPYRSFSMNAISPKAAEFWTEGVSYVKLSGIPNNADILLYLQLKAGVTDIARVKLSKVTQEELQSAILRPGKDTVNFLRNSRFPLGLQTGWSVDRMFETGAVETDETSPGPSGFPSLKFRVDKMPSPYGSPIPVALYSEPFQTSDPTVPNHVMFAYKAKGAWNANVLDDQGQTLMSMKLAASNVWSTAKLDYNALPLARSFTIKFAGCGEIWIDAVRAWAGNDAPTYVPQNECEVALALPKSEVSPARIQFADEAARIDYCVTGALGGYILKTKAVNINGQERTLPDITLNGSLTGATVRLEKGTIPFDVFPETPYGQFRIEAWVERDGKRVSPFNELVVTRLRRPVYWNEDAPNSPFGCHFTASPITIPMMKAAGVNWVRLHDAGTSYIGWHSLEQEKGKWSFNDDCIQRYRGWKIKILGVLQTTPVWASTFKNSGKSDYNSYWDRYWMPMDWDDWSNYVKNVCSRYKGVIDGYYVWNEPLGAGGFHIHAYNALQKTYFTHSWEQVAAEQAKLCELAATAAKKVDPGIKISGANILQGGPEGRKWNQMLVDAGCYKLCDFADYHDYAVQAGTSNPGDKTAQNYQEKLAPLLRSGFKKTIHMSEGNGSIASLFSGGSSGKLTGMYQRSLPWEGESPAGNISVANDGCSFELSLLSLGVERINLYSAHSYEYLGKSPGVLALLCQDGYPHPALAAHSTMAWHLEDRKFVKWVQVRDKVWAYLFAGRGGTVAVISGSGKYQVPSLPELKVEDLFGNPSDGAYKGTMLYIESTLPVDKLAVALSQKQ